MVGEDFGFSLGFGFEIYKRCCIENIIRNR